MIKVINGDVRAIYLTNIPIKAVYVLGQLVFPIIEPENPDKPIEDILSCFYNGYWTDMYPWTDNLPWTD